MKNMKRSAVALFLVLVMGLTLAACGSAGSTSGSTGPDDEGTASTAAAGSEAGETRQTEETPAQQVVLQPFDTEPTIEETVLWDEAGVTVTALSLTYTDVYADVNLLLDNHSGSDLQFAGTGGAYTPGNAVNGYSLGDGYFSEDVADGETLETTASFGIGTLQWLGIDSIAEITLCLRLMDDDYHFTFLSPQTLKTSAADDWTPGEDTFAAIVDNGVFAARTGYTVDSHSMDVSYEDGGISITSVTLFSVPEQDYVAMMMEVVNDSDQDIAFQMEDTWVNGAFLYEGSWDLGTVNAGTRYVEWVNLSSMAERFYTPEDEGADPLSLVADGVDSFAFTFVVLDGEGDQLLDPQEVTLLFP